MSPFLQSTDRARTNPPSERATPGAALSTRPLVIGAVLFVLLATANGAGYRYGTSDQAFYIPVIRRAMDTSLFPRDASLIDAEGRLMLVDEVIAAVARTTGMTLPTLFLVGYIASMTLFWLAAALIGARIYQNRWATIALGAALTLRHRIPRTSANSFEPYFHPRMLAFSLGALAVAALLHRRDRAAIVLVACCAVIHITTALWFAVLIGVALAVLDIRWRRFAWVAVAGAAALLFIMVMAGPLRGALTIMDDVWLQAVASKDSLFANQWPLWAWIANLVSLPIAWWAHAKRMTRNQTTPVERSLLWGATTLVALLVATLPFVGAAVSLPVQFQISRIFWLVEFVAVILLIGVIADVRSHRLHVAVTVLLLAISAGRGAYVMLVEHPERALFEVRFRESDWQGAMEWLTRQPASVHVLADPGHAWKYGTSVRVSAERDVLIEEVKDSALAIYSRDVAVRVVDRLAAIDDFNHLTADRARELALRYGLDYLVTEHELSLIEAYRNDTFHIYTLR